MCRRQNSGETGRILLPWSLPACAAIRVLPQSEAPLTLASAVDPKKFGGRWLVIAHVPYLDEVAARVGYPLYMKPYDGGGWRGVSRIGNADDLHRAYNSSGEMLMHLQAAVDGYDVFARASDTGAVKVVLTR